MCEPVRGAHGTGRVARQPRPFDRITVLPMSPRSISLTKLLRGSGRAAAAIALAAVVTLRVPDPAQAQERGKGEAADKAAPAKPLSHRSQRLGMFGLTLIEGAAIVMLGDSMTERAQWSEITGCHFVANRGISGDSSSGLLRRIDDVTKLKPLAVFLMIGVNDIHANVPVDRIAANVRQVLAELTGAGITVYLTSVLPVTQTYARKLNPQIRQLNALYDGMRSEKVQLVDFTREMSTADGSLAGSLSVDGLHLSTDGYRVWRDAILPIVKENCVLAPKPARAARTGQ